VRRAHDHRGRRRIIVEPIETLQALETTLFGTLQEQFDEVLDVYSDEQLVTIADFLTRATQHAREAIATLNQRRVSGR
jgi:DNA-binding MarR family transcriptional regulator